MNFDFDADPDPAFQEIADPCESRSESSSIIEAVNFSLTFIFALKNLLMQEKQSRDSYKSFDHKPVYSTSPGEIWFSTTVFHSFEKVKKG
jgi:hypothetical protein